MDVEKMFLNFCIIIRNIDLLKNNGITTLKSKNGFI